MDATGTKVAPTAHGRQDWEHDLASLLNELSQVQSELLEVLDAKRAGLSGDDPRRAAELQEQTEQLLHRLQACHERRIQLLDESAHRGSRAENLGKLAMQATAGNREKLARQVKEASHRMRIVHQQCLSNWVLAQRSLLHVAQMLEIIATGGRLQATYGNHDSVAASGALVDHAA
jgi:flagellar biosynthesis/type III secretory pathway chaperone